MSPRLLPETIKEKNRIIWENIKEEDDLVRAKNMIANGSQEAIADIYNQMTSICSDSASVSKAVLGNGDPSESIVVRLKVVETDLKKIKDNFTKVLWIVITPLVVALVWALVKLIATSQ
jgi:hypothetical protein